MFVYFRCCTELIEADCVALIFVGKFCEHLVGRISWSVQSRVLVGPGDPTYGLIEALLLSTAPFIVGRAEVADYAVAAQTDLCSNTPRVPRSLRFATDVPAPTVCLIRPETDDQSLRQTKQPHARSQSLYITDSNDKSLSLSGLSCRS